MLFCHIFNQIHLVRDIRIGWQVCVDMGDGRVLWFCGMQQEEELICVSHSN